MKGWVKWLLGIGALTAVGGAAVYYYYRRQVDLLKNHLQYKFIGLQLGKAGMESTEGVVQMQIHSDSTIEAKVKSLYIELYVNGNKLGIIENSPFKGLDGVERDYFIIPAKGYSVVSLKVTISPNLIIANALQAVFSFIKKEDTKVSFIGNAKIQSAFLTVTVPVEYETSVNELMSP